MTRIVVLSDIFPPTIGGSGRWLWEIYSRFPEGTVQVVAGECAGAERHDRQAALPIERAKFGFSSWGLTNLGTLSAYFRLLRHVRRVAKGFGAVELHAARPLPEGWIGYLGAKLFGWQYTCFVHGEEVCYARGSRELGWMTRAVLGGAQRLVANSKSTRDLLVRDWSIEVGAIDVLHPGVDTHLYTPALDESVRTQLGWQDRTVLLTVGRLQRRKGQDTVIEALPRIRERIPNVLYSVVGGGEDRARLESLAAQHQVQDAVEFRGTPDDDELKRCYQGCDLFVLANREDGDDIEGFGIVLLEAQACGRPVVAGDSGGPRETLHEGGTGVVIDAADSALVAQTLIDLLAEPERLREMGRRAREWAVDEFDRSVQGHRAQILLTANASGGQGH